MVMTSSIDELSEAGRPKAEDYRLQQFYISPEIAGR